MHQMPKLLAASKACLPTVALAVLLGGDPGHEPAALKSKYLGGGMRETHGTSASMGWKQARRAAFVQDLLATFAQHPESLMSFEHVSQKLKLGSVQFLGLQDVRLDRIVGSVGRYSDFTHAFLPRRDHLQARWEGIEKMLTTGRHMPPIELYKVGQAYFVRDGNHRVSVARQHRFTTLPANVWEYETPVPLEPGANVDDLLCQTAHAAFMERTHADQHCPQLNIRLTQPDGYDDLLSEIEAYQQILSQIDRRTLPFDEAVTLWGELRYAPIVSLIRERHVLEEFPKRTETDLYLWLCHNQGELAARYEHQVSMKEAADDLTERFGQSPLPVRRLRQSFTRLTRALRALGRRKRTPQPPGPEA
jgi:hypothetical protein